MDVHMSFAAASLAHKEEPIVKVSQNIAVVEARNGFLGNLEV